MGAPMLELSNVLWRVNGQRIVEDITLKVRAGELTVMIGPSGAGKTTLLRLAVGLIAPSSGFCRNGFSNTAMVFQEPRLLPWANALDNVALPLEADHIGKSERREKAAQWLARLGFEPRDFVKRPLQLSGGMRARVAIARAFVTMPDFVIMDEPYAALDLGLRRDLQGLTRHLAGETGAAVLFVTHDLPEAVRLADRIVVIAGRPGRITAELANRPVEALAEVWTAAAALSYRPELRPVLDGLNAE